MSASAVLAAPNIGENPVVSFTFDDETEQYELFGGATLTESEWGNALLLDASESQYAQLPNSLTSGLTGDYTIAVDVYPADDASFARVFDIATGTDNTMFFTANGGGIPKFRFKGDDLYSGGVQLNIGEWNSVVITRRGNTGTLYINGVTAVTADFANDLGVLGETDKNYLGKSQYEADKYYSGMIDNFEIYDYAVSESAVKLAYNDELTLTAAYTQDGKDVMLFDSATPVTAEVRVNNYQNDTYSAAVVCASYKDGALIATAVSNTAEIAAGADAVITADVAAGADKIVTYIYADGEMKMLGEIQTSDGVTFPEAAPEDSDTTTIGVHDPTIFKDPATGTYYAYSTGMIDIFKSDDLINWTRSVNTLPELPDCVYEKYSHESAEEYSNIWAPDMYYNEDDPEHPYYLTCSYSDAFGMNNSSIILFKAASPEGPWEDGEIIFTSDSTDETLGTVNAIDSNIIEDAETGARYMAYGSFWSGIHIKEFSDDFTLDTTTVGDRIFSRYRGVGGPEGAYIIYNPDTEYYYAFTSYDSLSDTYNIRIGRSKTITGPYVDQNGDSVDRYDDDVSLANNIYGYKLTGSFKFGGDKTYYGPGHNSVLNDDGNWYLINHTREVKGGVAILHVRTMLWTEDGWPIVMPERYAGEELQVIPESMISGTWDYLPIGDNVNTVINSEKITLTSGGAITGAKEGTWSFDGQITLTLNFSDGETVTSYVMAAYDRDRDCATLMLSGTNAEGLQRWAKKGTASETEQR